MLGLAVEYERRFEVTRAIVAIPDEHLTAYIRLIDQYAGTLPAWCWFMVSGMPAS